MIRPLLAATLALTALSHADIGADLVAEMNLARTQPKAYARIVADRGAAAGASAGAIREAVRFLERQGRVPALVLSPGLSQAALSHVIDAGGRGFRSHRGSDGSNVSNRANRFGRWDGRIGENIYFGRSSARDAIVALIIDQGVGDRGHRSNIFEKTFRYVGAAAGPHVSMGAVFVTDFAASYRESGERTAGL
ncbi:MAG: CAP domain-containing protein [Chthoniobacteraceae bacterium]